MGRGLRGLRPWPETTRNVEGIKGKSAAKLIPGGYSVEGFISRRALARPLLVPGKYVGLNFSLNLAPGEPGYQWSASQELQTWRRPDTWGDLLLLGSDARLTFTRGEHADEPLQGIVPNDIIYAEVADADMNINTLKVDRVPAELMVEGGTASLFVVLSETGPNTGVFRASVNTQPYFMEPKDSTLNVQSGNIVELVYTDARAEYGEKNRKVTAELPVGWPVMTARRQRTPLRSFGCSRTHRWTILATLAGLVFVAATALAQQDAAPPETTGKAAPAAEAPPPATAESSEGQASPVATSPTPLSRHRRRPRSRPREEERTNWLLQIFGPGMWPLWLCSIILMALLLERRRALRPYRILDPTMIDRVADFVAEGQLDEAQQAAAASPTVLGQGLGSGPARVLPWRRRPGRHADQRHGPGLQAPEEEHAGPGHARRRQPAAGPAGDGARHDHRLSPDRRHRRGRQGQARRRHRPGPVHHSGRTDRGHPGHPGQPLLRLPPDRPRRTGRGRHQPRQLPPCHGPPRRRDAGDKK